MPIQSINIGNYANDSTGDDLRTAFQKVNANFTELSVTATVGNAVNLGSGTGIFKDKNLTNLEFKTLTSNDNSVTFFSTGATVDLVANTTVHNDTTPSLGGNLNLNNFYTYGGDVRNTMWGLDLRIINSLLLIMLKSNTVKIDFGSFTSPVGISGAIPRGYSLDFGYITAPSGSNVVDFGTFN
jgi:hypothetical protein